MHHVIGEFSFLVENFRYAAPTVQNFSELRWLESKLIYAKLYGFDRVGGSPP